MRTSGSKGRRSPRREGADPRPAGGPHRGIARVLNRAQPFETRILHRVAEAVEAGAVSTDLLTDLHAAIAQARERPPEEQHALPLMELAEQFQLPVDRLTELLATLEAQPRVTREMLLRRFVEACLAQQRDAYEADHHGGESG